MKQKPMKVKKKAMRRESLLKCVAVVISLLDDWSQQVEVNLSIGGNNTFDASDKLIHKMIPGRVYEITFKWSKHTEEGGTSGRIFSARQLGTKSQFREMMSEELQPIPSDDESP